MSEICDVTLSRTGPFSLHFNWIFFELPPLILMTVSSLLNVFQPSRDLYFSSSF